MSGCDQESEESTAAEPKWSASVEVPACCRRAAHSHEGAERRECCSRVPNCCQERSEDISIVDQVGQTLDPGDWSDMNYSPSVRGFELMGSQS